MVIDKNYMKILILAAMDKEVALLKNILENLKEIRHEGVAVYSGTVGGKEVYLAKCGIGKVNAALNALVLIQQVRPDLVINSGVAGGATGAPIGTLLVAESAAYHDVWCGPGTTEGESDGNPLYFPMSQEVLAAAKRAIDQEDVLYGLIATGDRFISAAEEIKEVHRVLPDAVAVDMESAAIAHACRRCGVPFAVLRVISDTPGRGENVSQYKDFWTKAPEMTFSAIQGILAQLQ